MKNLIKRFRDKFHSDLMARFDTLTARMDELNKRLSTLDGQSDVLLSRDDVPNLLPSETVETKFDDLDSIVTLSEDNATRAKYLLDFANSSIKHSGCIPTMLTPYEKRMLYLLAKYYFKGEGAIFDAGICLGGCTEALINGLSKNSVVAGGGGGRIYAYEMGKVLGMQYIFDIIKENYDVPYLTLDSDFSDIVKNNISKLPSTDIINLYIGDILEQEYPEKIEIMFLDVCKTDKVNFAMQKLFSRLIPGKSILIQEDYIHGWHPYIKLTMGYLAAGEYFEFLGCVSPSLVWLLKKPIPPDVLAINPYEEFSKYLKMFFYWNKVLTPPQALVVLASLSNSGAVTDIMMEACLREYEKHL